MKLVTIYSVGSCNPGTREGCAEALLEYKGRTKYLRLLLHDTTVNQCIIEGLIAGARLLKAPCTVRLVTATRIGVAKAMRRKGVNADLIRRLIAELRAKQCVFDFEFWEGRGDELRSTIAAGRLSGSCE